MTRHPTLILSPVTVWHSTGIINKSKASVCLYIYSVANLLASVYHSLKQSGHCSIYVCSCCKCKRHTYVVMWILLQGGLLTSLAFTLSSKLSLKSAAKNPTKGIDVTQGWHYSLVCLPKSIILQLRSWDRWVMKSNKFKRSRLKNIDICSEQMLHKITPIFVFYSGSCQVLQIKIEIRLNRKHQAIKHYHWSFSCLPWWHQVLKMQFWKFRKTTHSHPILETRSPTTSRMVISDTYKEQRSNICADWSNISVETWR